MDRSLKEYLKKIREAKRGVLLKDVTAADLLVACDWAESERGVVDGFRNTVPPNLSGACYLKYANLGQVLALAGRLVNARVLIPASRHARERSVIAFGAPMISTVLDFLLYPTPYLKYVGEFRDGAEFY